MSHETLRPELLKMLEIPKDHELVNMIDKFDQGGPIVIVHRSTVPLPHDVAEREIRKRDEIIMNALEKLALKRAAAIQSGA